MFDTALKKKRVIGIVLLAVILGLFLAFNRIPKLDTVQADLAAVNAPRTECFQGFCIDREPETGFFQRWWDFSLSYLRLVSLGMTFAFLAAGITEVFLFPRDEGSRFTGGGLKGVLRGFAVGSSMNLCSACIVPIASAFRRRGAPVETAIAITQGSSTLNIPALVMAALVFTPMLASTRIAVSIVGVLLLGPLVALLIRRRVPIADIFRYETAGAESGPNTWRDTLTTGLKDWIKASLRYLWRLGPAMALAGFAGGLVIQWLTPDTVAAYLGNNVSGIVVAATFGILINVPLLFEIPLVAALLLVGMGSAPAAALLFGAAAGGPFTFWGLARVMPGKAVAAFAAGTWSLSVIGGVGFLFISPFFLNDGDSRIVAVVALVFLAWLYYPFFPNPITLLLRSPGTEASSDSPDGQWSMTGRDLRLTRHIPVPSVQPAGRVLWSRNLGTPTRGAPVVHEGTVYVGGYFEVIALDSATGDELWQYEIATPLDHSVAVAGDAIYLGLTNHRVQAVDRNSRYLLWEFKTAGPISSSPVVSGGIVYVGSSDNFVYALDAATGKLLWKEPIVGELRSAPAVSDGLVYAAANLGDLYIFDARTGQAKLRYRASGNTKASPAVANGLAYFPAGGRIYAVDADAREIAGEYQFNRLWAQFYYWQIPGVPRPPVQKGGQWLFDPDFDPRERTTTGLVAAPAVTPETFYVGSFNGTFYAGDAHSGKEIWRFTADGSIFESAVAMGDRVYFGDSAGFLYALRRSDGEQIWKLPLDAPIEIAPVFAGDRFYVRTADGILHAIE